MQRRHFVKQSALSAAAILSAPLMSKETILGQAGKRYRLDTQWSRADATRYPVKDCHEMVQDSKGRILLLTNDTHNNVIIYSKKGKVLKTWGTTYPGAHGLTLFNENGTDVLFICDNSRHQVIKTTMDGQ
ncbi:MAG TPA: 6-bladed beta-propeller, partial [Flavihumibacter sp.]|nr:6-bladed beta-propeller [Flavihumibacter sp.]